ncbi:MAG: SGNH/GDSL hydrolase family protein [Kofleriaceae bacterium]|nr:SGNH/GDSL hydrolase family protein [Kofleriaceae bacterium]
MAKTFCIVGDSQSVFPGGVAERELERLGHTVRRLSNTGKGPHDYVRTPKLWTAYTSLVRSTEPDGVLLVFGSNDAPNAHLEKSLQTMKGAVRPKVLLSGPPMYPDPEHQKYGAAIREVYMRVFGEDYIDSYPHTGVELSRAPDKLHFTKAGAETWGVAMAAALVQRFA